MGTLLDLASLVVVPSGYKEDVVYSVKPTDGSGDLDFTRSNDTATRVNSAGLIEKVRTNLILQSNQFDTTWTNSGTITKTSGQTGYDGSTDAWLIDKGSSAAFIRQSNSQSGLRTLSVYAKSGTNDWILIVIDGSPDAFQYFDLSTGVLGATGANISAKITSVGNGWYRCSVTGGDTYTEVKIYPAEGDNVVSATSGNIYIQDAQLESGDIATEYIETTTAAVSVGMTANVPRLDYSGGGCPKLLLEPQRTNGIPNSEYFSGWTAINNVSLTENNTTSPEGVVNATLMSVSGAGSLLRSIRIGSQSTSTDKKTMSVFAKANTADTIQLYHSGELEAYVNFDLSSGEVGTSGTNSTGNIEPMGNDWYRCIATFDSAGNFGSSIYIGFATSSSAPYGGGSISDTSLSVYIYGAQYEIGSYATSYIPTLGAAVTRGADACFKTGISSLIGQTEGTAFIEFDPRNGTGERRFFLQLGTSTTTIYARIESNGTLTAQILNAGTDYLTSTGIAVPSGNNKFAVAYANNDAVLYLNGTQLVSSSSVVVPALSEIAIGNNSSGTQSIAGDVAQALLFPTRLTNTQLAELTTL